MCTATETGKPQQKPASKRVLQKTAKARGNLTGNKIIKQVIDYFGLIWICVKMEYEKVI